MKVEDWGVKKLGYEVQDNINGHYVFMKLKCLPNTLGEINREYRLDAQVIKHMTVVEKPPKTQPKAAPKAIKETPDGGTES